MKQRSDILKEISIERQKIVSARNEFALTESQSIELNLAFLKLEKLEQKVLTIEKSPQYSGDYTLEEIGKKLGGLSRERIRQIELAALKKLKNPKYGRQLLDYSRL
jgi:RNA polymerase primary sigma factor